MRITGIVNPLQALLIAALPKATGFAVPEPKIETAPPATTLGRPVSVEMLVTLAQSESPIDRRRRVAMHVDRGLRALEELGSGMSGLPAVERLQEVMAWTATLDEPHDPALAELVKEIELRMRVELAKHDIVV